jgi:hypothetical protein
MEYICRSISIRSLTRCHILPSCAMERMLAIHSHIRTGRHSRAAKHLTSEFMTLPATTHHVISSPPRLNETQIYMISIMYWNHSLQVHHYRLRPVSPSWECWWQHHLLYYSSINLVGGHEINSDLTVASCFFVIIINLCSFALFWFGKEHHTGTKSTLV